jgi:predicted small metal-binding protein
MSVELRCGDLMLGCDYVAKAESQDDLMKKVVEHAKAAHNITEITPDLAMKVKGAIKAT